MSSPIIPAAPAAPVAAAPTPAPAPVSTPAPVAPAAAPPAATVPTPAPTAPSGPQPPKRPDPANFGNAIEHYEAEVQWKQEIEAFKAENPGVAISDELQAPPAEAAPETKPAEGETKPTEGEQKPPEGETPAADEDPIILKDEPSLTPQALNELIKGDEALKAALEANPAAKGQLFKMAREHAELQQFKGIFPNAESANFAKKEAASKVALRTQFQMAETPEGMAKAFDSFMNEFAVLGPDGKQVIDAQGQPVYGDDLYAFGEHVVSRYTDASLSEVESRLAANQYATPEDRTRDEDLKIALQIINEDIRPSEKRAADPDLSSLAPDVRAQVQARLDEAKRIEAANATNDANRGKLNRQEQRKQGTTEFFQRSAARLWPQVDKIVEKLRGAGAIIPDWQLTTTLPGTNISAFQNEVGSRIQAFIKADPYLENHMMQLEMQYLQNPTPETMQQRVAYFDGILQSKDETGRSLLNRTVSAIVHKFGTGAADAPKTTQAAPNASQEPRQGAPVRPHTLSSDEAYKQAESQLAKEVHGWQNMTDSERMSQIFTRQRQLLTAK